MSGHESHSVTAASATQNAIARYSKAKYSTAAIAMMTAGPMRNATGANKIQPATRNAFRMPAIIGASGAGCH